jgi:hypothetical protein
VAATTTAVEAYSGGMEVRVLGCGRVQCKETVTYQMHSRFDEASRDGGSGGVTGRVVRGGSDEFYKVEEIGSVELCGRKID